MNNELHDDQRFGEYGLSNDEGAAQRRASLAADFDAQVAAKRAALEASQVQTNTSQEQGEQPGAQDALDARTEVEQRAFSERVAYADVKHQSKNFYKGLIASIVCVAAVVAIIMVVSRMMG